MKDMSVMETVIEIPVEHERNIFGSFDINIKKVFKCHNGCKERGC